MSSLKRLRKPSDNKRRAQRDRRPKSTRQLLKADARARAEEPITIPVTWLKLAVGLFLTPVCLVTTEAFLSMFQAAAGHSRSFLLSEELWFFGIGALMWVITFFGCKRPTYLYVLGHELTHAVFVTLCGGKVTDWSVSRDGGYIVTNKTNFLISLSPYFVPFWTLVGVILLSLVHLFVDIPWYPRILFATIGFTWAFHFMYTIWMITKNQPDLRENGTFFSLTLIYLINLLLICFLVVSVSPVISWGSFFHLIMVYSSDLFSNILGW